VAFVRAALGNNIGALTEIVDNVCSGKNRQIVDRFLNMMLVWFRDALVLSHGVPVINLDQQDDLASFVQRFGSANLTGAIHDVERAISLVDRNVYINLILMQLAVKLRRALPLREAQRHQANAGPT
jgi:hypothetical protein